MKSKTGKAWLTKLLAGAGGLLAASISLGYSLYERRQADVVPQVDVATPVEAGRWKVSVTGSALGKEMPNGAKISPGKKAIIVNMMLENLSAQSSNLYGDLIKPANLPDTSKPQYYLTRDRAILWDLQPRMPEAVTAVWEVPENIALPDVLRLQVEGEFFKPRDNLYSAPGWFPSGPVAEIALPLAGETPEEKP
ncbi:hypothetical protein J5277_30125 [Rhizobium sp. 16-449-1b]|uniref:hypothetical protein n=1 Tax=Rhizobium sp. 16-449-1b TaxID=2819989 RepID=UPI001ADD1AD9|nr:hypothetical protein [Rhizobium sp. 16-449-1b]MBO9198385.1 hypothetical protein [Rhizobium sp. 16-449-1b]